MATNTALTWKGGDKLAAYLASLGDNLKNPGSLKVGFLEGATYPDGTPVAYIASINEFGATINRSATQVTLYRKVDKAGRFTRGGRFVKKNKANFTSLHAVGAHTIVIPPRPFFRSMIKAKSGTWGQTIEKLLKATNFNCKKTLGLMGELIAGDLRKSIQDFDTPPNAPSTIAKKGKDNPLIDSGYMLSRVDYEVDDGVPP